MKSYVKVKYQTNLKNTSSKSNFMKAMTLIFAFIFVFCFMGCDGSDLGDGLGDGEVKSLDGAKVLSKPIEYDWDTALSGYSKDFYNILARNIMFYLYSTYEDQALSEDEKEKIFKDISTTNQTYENFTIPNNKFYLFDSLRYTIKSVTTISDSSNNVQSFRVELDTSSAWNWTLSGIDTAFAKYSGSKNNPVTLTNNGKANFEDFCATLFTSPNLPNLLNIYSAANNEKKDNELHEDYADFWYSPYYVEANEVADASMENFFQDAIEYAVYLTVLGYNMEENADFFDFEIVFNTNNQNTATSVSDIKVGGWESNKISLSTADGALFRAKQMYEKNGTYVGLTDKNKEDIANFILQKVIGTQALNADVFTVVDKKAQVSGGVESVISTENVKFSRNYDQIVRNIVNYACDQTPIGMDENGDPLFMSAPPYLTSVITDFEGDHFFASYNNDDDSKMFENVETAEYQNIVMFTSQENLNKNVTDIWLAFEYYYDTDKYSSKEEAEAALGKTFADSIKINVGLRYFDSTKNEIIETKPFQKTVRYAQNGEIEGEDPDVNWLLMGNSEDESSPYDTTFDTFQVKTEFNNNIGGGAINPFANITDIESILTKAKIQIGASSKAKDYYKLNSSITFGSYGTLKEDMFAGQCDFMEIYFDIEKDKSDPNINYNFKVVLLNYAVEED